MELIDYLDVLTQNEKVLGEMLKGSNSDAIKTTLRGLDNFQNGLAPFANFWKASRHPSVTLSRGVKSFTNGLLG